MLQHYVYMKPHGNMLPPLKPFTVHSSQYLSTGEALVPLYEYNSVCLSVCLFVCLFVCLHLFKLLLGKKSNLNAVFNKHLEIYLRVHSFKE